MFLGPEFISSRAFRDCRSALRNSVTLIILLVMKKNLVLSVLVLAAALLCLSCSKTGQKSGQEYVTEIVNNFNSRIESEEIVGDSDDSRIYLSAAESEDAARNDCSVWIYGELTGDSQEFVIPDGMGTVNVVKGESEGEYFCLTFKLEGYDEFMLKYMSPNKINDENTFPRPGKPKPLL